jgi:hypothetical protein
MISRFITGCEPGTLVLSAAEPGSGDGVPTTTTISWSRLPAR